MSWRTALLRSRAGLNAFDGVIVVVAARAGGQVVPARAQMAATLGFHIILACLGIALPSIVLQVGEPGPPC